MSEVIVKRARMNSLTELNIEENQTAKENDQEHYFQPE